MIQRVLQGFYLLTRFLFQSTDHLLRLRTRHDSHLLLSLRHNSLMQLFQNVLLLNLIPHLEHFLRMHLLSPLYLSLELSKRTLFDLANTHTQLVLQLCLVLLNLPLVLMLQLWDLPLVLMLAADLTFTQSLQSRFLSGSLKVKFLKLSLQW